MDLNSSLPIERSNYEQFLNQRCGYIFEKDIDHLRKAAAEVDIHFKSLRWGYLVTANLLTPNPNRQ